MPDKDDHLKRADLVTLTAHSRPCAAVTTSISQLLIFPSGSCPPTFMGTWHDWFVLCVHVLNTCCPDAAWFRACGSVSPAPVQADPRRCRSESRAERC